MSTCTFSATAQVAGTGTGFPSGTPKISISNEIAGVGNTMVGATTVGTDYQDLDFGNVSKAESFTLQASAAVTLEFPDGEELPIARYACWTSPSNEGVASLRIKAAAAGTAIEYMIAETA